MKLNTNEGSLFIAVVAVVSGCEEAEFFSTIFNTETPASFLCYCCGYVDFNKYLYHKTYYTCNFGLAVKASAFYFIVNVLI